MSPYRILTNEHVQSFLDKGYLVVKDCVDLELANAWIDRAYQRLGFDKHDPSTWTQDIVWTRAAGLPPRGAVPGGLAAGAGGSWVNASRAKATASNTFRKHLALIQKEKKGIDLAALTL